MAQNLLGKIFNKQPEVQESSTSVSNSAAKSSDGLTGVARYLQDKQAPQQTAVQETSTTATQQAADPVTTSVAKYVANIKPAALTGVAKYLVNQIIPEYKIKAAAAAKAAAPTGVASYLAKVTAAAVSRQPAVPSSVENYLKKIG